VLTRSMRFDPSLLYPPYKGWKTHLMRKAL
jgi:hypothetical protein